LLTMSVAWYDPRIWQFFIGSDFDNRSFNSLFFILMRCFSLFRLCFSLLEGVIPGRI
jgi:hypothetical protein